MMGWILGRFRPIEAQPVAVGLIFGAIMLAVRMFVADPYWASGLTKWVSFPGQLSAGANYLFTQEYRLHLFGLEMGLPFPELMALLSGYGEIILPVLLIAGLVSRPAALGLLAMTAIIQLVYPDGWTLHVQWAAASLAVVIFGPGMFSIDWLLRRFGLAADRRVTPAS